MKRLASFLSTVAFAGCALCTVPPAWADEIIAVNGICSSLGVTQMATNQQNLVACMKNSSGVLVWKSMTGGSVPVGAIVAWPSASAPSDPDNWLECNGQAIPAGYTELISKVGPTVPDLRGKFLRGLGGNSAALGTTQGDAVGPHTHTIAAGVQDEWDGTEIQRGRNGSAYWLPGEGRIGTDTGSNETRPINMAVYYLIRAQ